MPNLIVPKEALLNWANAQIDDLPTLNDCRMRLFRTSNVIDADTTAAELVAAEADFPGYAPMPMGDWSPSVIVAGEAVTEPDTAIFTATADDPQDVYGCFCTSLAGNKLWFAAKFDAAIPTPFGTELRIDTSFNLRSIFTS